MDRLRSIVESNYADLRSIRSYHSGSSQYASVNSDLNSDDSLHNKRISWRPSSTVLIYDRMTPMEARSPEAPKLSACQLQSYFEVAIKKYDGNGNNMDNRNADLDGIHHDHRSYFPICGDGVGAGVAS